MSPESNMSGSVGPASCCTPGRSPSHTPLALLNETPSLGGFRPEHAQVSIPAGSFHMGDAFNEGYPADGETPVHRVCLDAFSLDETAVTNRMFASFVQDTGYRTESEIYGSSAVFHLDAQASKTDVLGRAADTPWWLNIRGADWTHPAGPHSTWKKIPDHPVVQISHNDALAYCQWAGRRLPTEAEWEYAARGGLAGKRYAWGDELHGPAGEHLCNIWQGQFPAANTKDDGFSGTAPVRTFAPNGYGLYEMAGNVWEWCADWFLPRYYRKSPEENPTGPTIGSGRVMRGGSYLCHDSYCNRYRVAARSKNMPDSATSNCGFRTAAMK